jgi:hypothetical protein
MKSAIVLAPKDEGTRPSRSAKRLGRLKRGQPKGTRKRYTAERLKQGLLKWFSVAGLMLAGATMLAIESETLVRILRPFRHNPEPVSFGGVPHRPLHEHSAPQLVAEVHEMGSRGVPTNHIVAQTVLEHLPQPASIAKTMVPIHRHDAALLESEVRGLAELHLSSREIVERLLMFCSIETEQSI